ALPRISNMFAGFKERPFHLKRNEVSPPLDLQRKVFPFIESSFDNDKGKDQTWRKECDMEMMEYNPNEKRQLRDIKPRIPMPSTYEKAPVHFSDSMRAKQCYLRMLLRTRRIILQDAAEYLCEYSYLQSHLLKNKIFQTQGFQEFKGLVKERLQIKERSMPDGISPKVLQLFANQREESKEEQSRLERVITALVEERREMRQEMQRNRAQLTHLTALPTARPMSLPVPAAHWTSGALWSPGLTYPSYTHPAYYPPPVSESPNSYNNCSSASALHTMPARATAKSMTAGPAPPSFSTRTPAVLPTRGYAGIAPRPKQGAPDPDKAEEFFEISYYLESAGDVYEEYTRCRTYRASQKRQGKAEDILPKTRKQLSNRKFIVMEVEYIQQQGIQKGLINKQALTEAFAQLTRSMSETYGGKKLSINKMVEYCRRR
ncbi:hypothetical protein BG011_001611, partial [Mortierella polycephala]